MADFDFDLSEFTESLRQYVEVTQKDVAEVINKKAKDVAFRAAKKTTKAAAASIDRFKPGKDGAKERKLFHALAATGATKFGKAVKGRGNFDLAKKIYSKRKSAIGYSQAIWLRIAKDFGAKLRGKFNIAHAEGIPAKPGVRPVAKLNADGLEIGHISRTMEGPLIEAMRESAADMEQHIQKKLAERAAQHSAR